MLFCCTPLLLLQGHIKTYKKEPPSAICFWSSSCSIWENIWNRDLMAVTQNYSPLTRFTQAMSKLKLFIKRCSRKKSLKNLKINLRISTALVMFGFTLLVWEWKNECVNVYVCGILMTNLMMFVKAYNRNKRPSILSLWSRITMF